MDIIQALYVPTGRSGVHLRSQWKMEIS